MVIQETNGFGPNIPEGPEGSGQVRKRAKSPAPDAHDTTQAPGNLNQANLLAAPDWSKTGAVPFDRIKDDMFYPAILQGLAECRCEIGRIVKNPSTPTFKNTVLAYERAGATLGRAVSVLRNLRSAHSREALRRIWEKVEPQITELHSEIGLNPELFARIEHVYNNREALIPEEKRLTEVTYNDFVREGAGLAPKEAARLAEIDSRLAKLQTQFNTNVREDAVHNGVHVKDASRLKGLSPNLVQAAKERAEKLNLSGHYFSCAQDSYEEIMVSADDRALRREMFQAYATLCARDGEHDNRPLIKEIMTLRNERVELLNTMRPQDPYKHYADYVLVESFPGNAQEALKSLMDLWEPVRERDKEEVETVRAFMKKSGVSHDLKPWDFRYYVDKYRAATFSVSEDQLKAYMSLNNMREAAFELSGRLFGVTFKAREDLPVYHPDVSAFEVRDARGEHLGIIYLDYAKRDEKASGAWMNTFRSQQKHGEDNIRPVVINVCNFPSPGPDGETLLTVSQVQTLFHELGHGLHALLSQQPYARVFGTSVPRDFVEMPSQILENWVTEPEFLKEFALHHKTKKPMPKELIQAYTKAAQFGTGFETGEYLAASIVDLKVHTEKDLSRFDDVEAFEQDVLASLKALAEIPPRYRMPYFRHIFDHGYAANYGAYNRSAVLDADGFEPFKQNGLYHQETAAKLKKLYEGGFGKEPMDLYVDYRGHAPKPDALMRRLGIKKA